MAIASRSQNAPRGFYQRVTVACQKCGSPVIVHKPKSLGDEFSVPCGKCRHRGIYSKRSIFTQDMPERRKKPRD